MLRILHVYTVNLQVGSELCLKIAWKSFDCPIVSLNEVFLYDTPLKVTLDYAQSVFFSDPVLSGHLY